MTYNEREHLKATLADLFFHELNVNVPSTTADLFETGVLDSQRFVELLLHLEQRFGTQINIEDFEIENFRSIENIAGVILERTPRTTLATPHLAKSAS